MKKVISSIEVAGRFQRGGAEWEVCATAEADHDSQAGQAVIELDSFVRPVDITRKEEHLAEAWLPQKQVLKESVSRSEASDLAKDAFHRWVAKVRQSMPPHN